MRYSTLDRSEIKSLQDASLEDSTTVSSTRVIFIVRIIIETVILLLNFVGFSVTLSWENLEEALQVCVKIFKGSHVLLKVVEKMVESFRNRDLKGVSRSIIELLRELFTIKALSKIIKAIWKSLSWFDVIVAIVKSVCYLATVFLTGMVATIARIVSWIIEAAEFLLKLRDLCALEQIDRRLRHA